MKTPLTFAFLIATSIWAGTLVAQFRVVDDGAFTVLENGTDTRVTVAPEHGGEMAGLSVYFKGSWHELLYRGRDYSDQPGWRGKAPLLWPATGITLLESENEKVYQQGDEFYPMPMHGFARNQTWEIINRFESETMASLTLKLSDNEQTRKIYPFGFDLQVEYQLSEDRLSLIYRVKADSGNSAAMPFSIGNHITFNAPLVAGSEASQLQFDNDFPDQLLRNKNKIFTGEVESSPFSGRQKLGDLPARQAVSLGGQKTLPEITIFDPSGLELQLIHQSSSQPADPSIQFNLWADEKAGFFSPEPWVGTQNSLNTSMGLISLLPSQSWQWQIDVIPRLNKIDNEIDKLE